MSKLLASLMRNYFPKRPSGAPLHTLWKLYDVHVGFVPPPPLFWGWILLILRSPKGGCCSISDALSCSWWYAENGTWMIKWLSCYIEQILIYLLESRNPVFIRSIAPNHNFSVYPVLFCSRLPTIIRASYICITLCSPYPRCIPSTSVRPTFRDSIVWIAYMFLSQHTGTYMFFLKIHISTFFSNWYTYPPPPHLYILFSMFGLDYNQFQHLLCLIFSLSYTPLPIYLLKMTLKPLNRRRTYVYSISSREFEECLNKAGNHTWRKRRQNENRKPVSWNGIRLLLFDKCKFTKPFQRTKSWTRQTTHWSHIYQI